MLTPFQRILVFFLVCIPVRATLALLAKRASPEVLRLFGYLALLSGLRFAYQFYHRSGGVGVFGGSRWWDKYALVHGFMYLAFAFAALNGSDRAWVFALADVVLAVLFRLVQAVNE